MMLLDLENLIECPDKFRDEMLTYTEKGYVKIYFAETIDLYPFYHSLGLWFEPEEKAIAEKFHSKEEGITYIICHTILRQILSKTLKKKAVEIKFVYNENGKPGVLDDIVYFNISHTKDAFAIVFSESCRVGIDLERIRKINFKPLINRFFSKRESEYILETPSESINRFFKLWTRKEAFLKAIGTGIIQELSEIEVLRNENNIKNIYFEDLNFGNKLCDHYIFSQIIKDYYLSFVMSEKSNFTIYQLNRDNFRYLL